jgi:hypothetical protein
MKSLKITMLYAVFYFVSPLNTSAAIFQRDTLIPKQASGDEVCEKELKKSIKSTVGGASIFVIPLGSAVGALLLAKGTSISSTALAMLGVGALISFGFILFGFVEYFRLRRKLKRRDFSESNKKEWTFADRIIFPVLLLAVGLAGLLPIFTLSGLGLGTISVKILSLISGIVFTSMGFAFLFGKNKKQTDKS